MEKGIKELFVGELQDLLSAETQIVKALPKVVKAAHSEELKKAFSGHLKETKEQVARLEKIFKLLKLPKKKKFCHGMQGLIEECSESIEEFKKSPLRDVSIISKAQRIEHYEISAYGTVRRLAQELGFTEAVKLLTATLEEESGADSKLTKIAESGVNREAIDASIPKRKTAAKKK